MESLFHWLVLSDEQMSNGWPVSLLNDEQMSNWLGAEHQPVHEYINNPTCQVDEFIPNNDRLIDLSDDFFDHQAHRLEGALLFRVSQLDGQPTIRPRKKGRSKNPKSPGKNRWKNWPTQRFLKQKYWEPSLLKVNLFGDHMGTGF